MRLLPFSVLLGAAIAAPTPAPATLPRWLHWTDEASMKTCNAMAAKPCAPCVACHKAAIDKCAWGKASLTTSLGAECYQLIDYLVPDWLWGKAPATYNGTVNLTTCAAKWGVWQQTHGENYNRKCVLEHERCSATGCSGCWKCREKSKPDQRCAEKCKQGDFCHMEISHKSGEWDALVQCHNNTANNCPACDTCVAFKGEAACATTCQKCRACQGPIVTQYNTMANHTACAPKEAECRKCLTRKVTKTLRKRLRLRARKAARKPVKAKTKKDRRAARMARYKKRRLKKRALKKARRAKRKGLLTPTAPPTSPGTGQTVPAGCFAVTPGMTSPSAGNWKCGTCTTWVQIPSGSSATSAGIFCPNAATASPTVAGTGQTIPTGCVAVSAGMTAPTAGYWKGTTGSGGTWYQIPQGAVSPSAGIFCPSSAFTTAAPTAYYYSSYSSYSPSSTYYSSYTPSSSSYSYSSSYSSYSPSSSYSYSSYSPSSSYYSSYNSYGTSSYSYSSYNSYGTSSYSSSGSSSYYGR